MQISIIGCGWLGLSLGKHWVAQKHIVYGTSTNPIKLQAINQAGIMGEILILPKDNKITSDNSNIWLSDIFVIAVPPKVKSLGTQNHIDQITNVLSLIQNKNAKIIYISSTSVYANDNTTKTEESPVEPQNALVLAENLIKKSGFIYSILRCGGLMGYDRYAGKYYAGKTIELDNCGVNYVHQNDVIAIIDLIVTQNIYNHTFNVCAPEHPLRQQVIISDCQKHGLELPIFLEPQQQPTFKLINPQKWINMTNYTFQYPNPLFFK